MASLSSSGHGRFLVPGQGGCFLPAANSWGKDGQEVEGIGRAVRFVVSLWSQKWTPLGKRRNSLFFPQPRGFEMKNFLECFVFSVSSVECSVCVGGLGDGEGAACNIKPDPPLLHSSKATHFLRDVTSPPRLLGKGVFDKGLIYQTRV